MIDRKKLRELASAASPGPYRECGAERGGCQCGLVWSLSSDCPVFEAQSEKSDGETDGYSLEQMKRNAGYAAAVSPDVLLELLGQLDESEATIASMSDARNEYFARLDMLAGIP